MALALGRTTHNPTRSHIVILCGVAWRSPLCLIAIASSHRRKNEATSNGVVFPSARLTVGLPRIAFNVRLANFTISNNVARAAVDGSEKNHRFVAFSLPLSVYVPANKTCHQQQRLRVTLVVTCSNKLHYQNRAARTTFLNSVGFVEFPGTLLELPLLKKSSSETPKKSFLRFLYDNDSQASFLRNERRTMGFVRGVGLSASLTKSEKWRSVDLPAGERTQKSPRNIRHNGRKSSQPCLPFCFIPSPADFCPLLVLPLVPSRVSAHPEP